MPGNFGAFKAVAVGAGAARLSAELADGYRNSAGGDGGDSGGGMGLGEAVRLAARVLSRERERQRKSKDTRAVAAAGVGGAEGKTEGGKGDADGEQDREDFGDIGMEIATIAVGDRRGPGGAEGVAAASSYIYSDADVERVLKSIRGGEIIARRPNHRT